MDGGSHGRAAGGLEGLKVWLVVVALGMKILGGAGLASSAGAAFARF